MRDGELGFFESIAPFTLPSLDGRNSAPASLVYPFRFYLPVYMWFRAQGT
jgi:hypothetical protein